VPLFLARVFGGPETSVLSHATIVPPPPCARKAAVPKIQAKQRFNAHPVLSHNLTMDATTGIPPAGNHRSQFQQTRQSSVHESSKRSRAAATGPARRQSRHHPMLSRNPMMAVTSGIPPAGKCCSHVPESQQSRDHKLSKRVLSFNDALAVTPGIPPSANACLDKAVLERGGGGTRAHRCDGPVASTTL
jgi:hypothetical protein